VPLDPLEVPEEPDVPELPDDPDDPLDPEDPLDPDDPEEPELELEESGVTTVPPQATTRAVTAAAAKRERGESMS
jgi:hypothetical protein